MGEKETLFQYVIHSLSFQWKETDSSQLMDSKLKCVFVMPDSNNVTANGAATSETSKPASEFHAAATNSAVSATQAMTSSSSPKVYPFSSYYQKTILKGLFLHLQLRHSAEIPDGNVADKSGELKKSVDEIRNLNEEISRLRQENLQLKVKRAHIR